MKEISTLKIILLENVNKNESELKENEKDKNRLKDNILYKKNDSVA